MRYLSSLFLILYIVGCATGCSTPARRGVCRYQGQDSREGIEREDVRCGIESNLALFAECYEKKWLNDSTLSRGPLKVRAEFTIQPNGRTRSVAFEPPPAKPEFVACLSKALTGTQFPRHRSDAVKVSYPIVFRTLDSVGTVILEE
jgi:hypothetical protein